MYARDTKNLEMESKSMSRSKCPKWYASHRHPKGFSHTKFGIPTSNDIRLYAAPDVIILETRS